jgi:hypothetical protein
MVPVEEVVAGRYRIVRPLANGGMSRVWLATDDRAGVARQVALKQCTIPDGLAPAQRQAVLEWAFPEARAAARVRHPNLIHTYGVHPDPAGPWIVMEYVPSRSLQEIIEDDGPLPPARVAGIGLAVLAALAAANDAGVLHLDVKPGNVLIGDDGRVVLTDFGPAVTSDGIRALTEAGVVLGSPKYIAPERLFEHTSTVASDLWSLGATLYHAVEGRPPYLRSSTTGVLRALADTEPEPPRRAGALTPVLEGLLRRDPATRLTVAEVEVKLRKAAGVRRPSAGRWWTPLRLRRGIPEEAREATAAERAAAAAAPAETLTAAPGETLTAVPDETPATPKETPAALEESSAVPEETPATPAEAPVATEETPAESGAARLGRSVDEVSEPGRPWLRRRLSAAAAVIALLALFAAVAAGSQSRDDGGAARPGAAAVVKPAGSR